MPPSPRSPSHGPSLTRLWLLGALVVCAALYVSTLLAGRLRPAFPNTVAQVDGDFPLNGFFHGDSFRGANGVRLWGSWAGGDEKTGALRIGPFEATSAIKFGVTGYPSLDGERLELERTDTHERFPVRCSIVGERWQLVRVELPQDWIGKQVSIVARDESRKPNGWLGVSEPVRCSISAPFLEALTSFAVTGMVLAVLWLCAAKRFAQWFGLPPHWVGLVTVGFVAFAGYAAFWAFFAGPTMGRIFVIGLVTAATADLLTANEDSWRPIAGALVTARSAMAVGLFILSLLYLFSTSRDFYDLAATRWLDLPGDNTLPHNVSATLYGGGSLRWPGAEWQSSDRPPLQSGWMLLTWPFAAVLRLDARIAGAASASWFQLAWVFAASGLLRSLGVSRRQSAVWTALFALCGFFILNTAFTWPKLGGGAFACGSFGLWVLTPAKLRTWRHYAAGALLAGLAWLSHGGVAFSLIAIAPWGIAAALSRWREWALVALVFTLTVAPWLIYQRFYDPPGNRLVKWHIGGQVEKDPRGTWQTIREDYAAKPAAEILAARVSNLRFQFSGDWTWWREFSPNHNGIRRGDEFFVPLRALTWWVVGFAALPFALIRLTPERRHVFVSLAGWIALSFLVWIGLLFLPDAALIHQGSYAFIIALFVLLSAALSTASRTTIYGVAALQSVGFATTWVARSTNAETTIVPLAATTAIVSLSLLWWSTAQQQDDRAAPDAATALEQSSRSEAAQS